MSDETKPTINENHHVYVNQRISCVEQMRKSSDLFGRSVLIISSGTLGLSMIVVTILRWMRWSLTKLYMESTKPWEVYKFPNRPPDYNWNYWDEYFAPYGTYTWLMVMGWALLAVGILLSLSALLANIHSRHGDIKFLEARIKNLESDLSFPKGWSGFTTFLNWSALFCTVAGTVFVTIFIWCRVL